MENTKDEIREFLVLGEEEGDRLDVYLSSQLGEMSRSYIQKIIKDKKVKVNGKIEKAKYAVKEDDSVVIEIPAPKLLEVIPQDIPIDIVYEDDKVLAFNDINPVAPYHILVVPKKHYESILDVNAEDMDIIAHIHKVINIIANEKGFAQNGFRIINNCGADGGQEVKHIHFHVLAGKKLPMYEKDAK